MSGAYSMTLVNKSRGVTGFTYGEVERYMGRVGEVKEGSNVFYGVIRLLSGMVVIAFVALLISSIITSGPIHWAIAAVGCLGSIGFAGAVWLSKSYVARNNV